MSWPLTGDSSRRMPRTLVPALMICAALDLQAPCTMVTDVLPPTQLRYRRSREPWRRPLLRFRLLRCVPIRGRTWPACPEFAHFVGDSFGCISGAGGCFDFVEVFAHGSFFDLCGCAAPLFPRCYCGGAAACGRASAEGGVRRCEGCEGSRVSCAELIPIWRGVNRMCGAGFCRSFGRGFAGAGEAEDKICLVRA